MASSSSSSSISGSNPSKHDLFLSFRGEDTRKNFTCHLYDALFRSGIRTFIDNREVEKGDGISSSLSNAIRSSSLSIIIFSQNYASSSWCLDELLEIIECYETRRQIIIPIFYRVSHSDIRKQNGTYGEAFAKHEERFKEMKDKVQKWRAALTQVAALSGWELKPDDEQLETEFIEKIVKDVLAKLNSISSVDHLDPGLVGIRSRVETVESLLCLDSLDFCMVGIWGMGGIGKTTIARAVYNRIANQFIADCFLENVRNDATNGLNHLQKKLLSGILGEGNHYMNDFTIRRLRCMKIFIVIDDVDNSSHLKVLVGDRSWFGPGSRIIVTSRDRQVLKNVVDEFKLYEVEGLNDVEAPQLFSLNAFKQSHSPEDRMELSSIFVHYAKGNPLALKVLGCSLFEKSMEEWESSLDKLKTSLDSNILDVLRVSYDRLDYQGQKIFLFIACFFKGGERDRVTTILNGCGFSAPFVISDLVDKCLLTVTYDNWLSMHDLIQEMGRDVVFKESVEEPGKRSRLWDPQDICDLFENNTGTEAVESISLDLRQISDQLYICPNAFTRMPNLKLLKFYFSSSDDWMNDWRTASDYWRYHKWRKEMNKVKIICEGLESLPDKLRFISWPGYPLKYLPLKPKHLVDLEMPYSKLQHLWKDTKLGKKLRRIDLSECRELTEVPDLYQATNLESMQLGWCSTLTESPKFSSNVMLTRLCLSGTAIEEVPYSAIKCLSKIVSLNISYNKRLRNLPSMCHLTSLEKLYLIGCSNITEFPDVSGAITYLYLSRTAIKEVPYSAIECLSKIVELDISNNKRLRNLPSMRHLTSLENLYLRNCSKITKFPDVPEAITHLYLSDTGIEEVPYSAIKSLSKIVSLDLSYNKRLRNLPNMPHLTSLDTLSLTGCSNITEFPDISNSGEINTLYLGGTGIEEVPSFVGRLTKLRNISLYQCKRLEKVSSSIFQLELGQDEPDLSGCSKLENFPEVLENEGMLHSSIETIEMMKNMLLSSSSGLCYLRKLDLSECNMEVLPSALSRLSSLDDLSLMGNEFESLSLELFTSLTSLDISYCKRLRYLQDLPSRLNSLDASHCTSLETLPDANGVSTDYESFYNYYNCFKLDESARVNIQADARLRTQLKDSAFWSSIDLKHPTNIGWQQRGRAFFCFPGSEIPEWFVNQNQTSSIEIDMPPHWYSNKFMGFVMCFIASCKSSIRIEPSDVKFECKFKDPDCDGQDIIFHFPVTDIEHPTSNHVFIVSFSPETISADRKSDGKCFKKTDSRFNTENSSSWEKARFRFSTSKGCCKVKKCGIKLVFSEQEDQVFETEQEDQVFETESEEEDCHSEYKEEVVKLLNLILQHPRRWEWFDLEGTKNGS